jgi:hypothetical protein
LPCSVATEHGEKGADASTGIKSDGFSYPSVMVHSAFLDEEMDNSGLFGFF